MENERQLWKNRSRVRAAIILKDYPEGIISRKHMRSFSKKGFRQYLSAGLLRRWGAHQQVCTYVGVWDCYATEAFHNPEAYNLLFFEYNNVKLKEAMREYYEMFPEDIVNVNRFFYNMLQTPSFLARDFEMCKRCINVGGITYDNAVKLNRMVCMLFEGYFKDVYENGVGEEQIPERVKLMVDDVDTIVMALANNLKGYKGYRK